MCYNTTTFYAQTNRQEIMPNSNSIDLATNIYTDFIPNLNW